MGGQKTKDETVPSNSCTTVLPVLLTKIQNRKTSKSIEIDN